MRPRFAVRSIFAGLLLAMAAAVLWLWPLPALDSTSAVLLLCLWVAALAAELFTIDFPDRKNVSVGYVFPLIASAMLAPQAGMVVAGAAGLVAGLVRGQRVRSALLHGPQLALAAGAAAAMTSWLFGGISFDLSWTNAACLLLFAGVYTTSVWGLGRLEELLADKPGSQASVDLLTNLVLVPLPFGIAPLYERLGLPGVLLAVLGMILLLIAAQAYENLVMVHHQLKQAYARLAEQERQLELSLETNREMSQVVSHDLRGPLTSVMGYTELLRGSLEKPAPDVQKQVGYVNSIEGNSRRILSLANKLLDLHRMEEGGTVDVGSVQAASVVRQVVDELRVQAEQKQLELVADINPDLPVLQTCEWMLREVAENLISNAVKYTPEAGRVIVRLRTSRQEVLFEVEDNGIGMSPEDQARLFTKFFRGASKEVRKQQGTGLGLALTKSMIERLGGVVEVWSELGRGSRFSVYLPLELQPAAADALARA
ncbi:MAG: HAMP domain-containing histidine kinase [Chloroflexi bacterium]|nr:HAMP domain-containing histidine kinase [Chloroflexota bacterium]